MKKIKSVFICLALVCLYATCASSPIQEAVNEPNTEQTVPVSTALAPTPAPTPTPTPVPVQDPAPDGFVRINGGTFTMGSPANEVGRSGQESQFQVTLNSYYMAINPVTVGEFRQFVNATGYQTEAERGVLFSGGLVWTVDNAGTIGAEIISNTNWRNPNFTQGENHPVVMVSWFDVIEYCNWLSIQNGFVPAYTVNGTNVTWNRNANGYRLPTEAEWEYACRAGTTTAYNTGSSINTNQANYDNTLRRTTPVGNYTANRWGLYDMHGNVSEWCWDWNGDYPNSAQNNPVGAASGDTRIFRGGNWFFNANGIRSGSRGNSAPVLRMQTIGFRLVRSIISTTSATELTTTAPQNPTITIVNNTGYTAHYVYLTETTSNTWGQDRLRSDQVLRNGESVSIQLPHPINNVNQYDFRLVDSDGDVYDKINITVSANSRIEFTMSDIKLPIITVVNNTGQTIFAVFVLEPGVDTADNSISSNISNGQSVSLQLPKYLGNVNQYHILIADTNNNFYIKANVNVRDNNRIVFTMNDRIDSN